MPYYNELDVENVRPFSAYGQVFGTLLNYRFGTSFRNRPKAQYSVPVLDQQADPYAWFISSVMEARMNANHVPYIQDRGHAWHSERHTATTHSYGFTYRGVTYPINGGFIYPLEVADQGLFKSPQHAASVPSSDDLAAFGQQAIARCRPVPSTFSGAQFLGELREGLPKLAGAALVKSRVKDVVKEAGSEYLNVQFGWKPLLADLRSLAETVLALDSVLAAKRTSQGLPKKAKFALPPYYESQEVRSERTRATVTNLRIPNKVLPMGLQSSWDKYLKDGVTSLALPVQGSYYLRTVRRQRKFEGMFTSFFDYPPVDASWVEKARSLLLQDYTPEALWELAPWSWLVDWVFHIQSSIQANAVASDKRVVMNYGYVTEELSYKSMFTGRVPDNYDNPSYPVRYHNASFGVTTTDVVKRRIRANPFGLQVTNPGQLNADQMAILAALGASWRR